MKEAAVHTGQDIHNLCRLSGLSFPAQMGENYQVLCLALRKHLSFKDIFIMKHQIAWLELKITICKNQTRISIKCRYLRLKMQVTRHTSFLKALQHPSTLASLLSYWNYSWSRDTTHSRHTVRGQFCSSLLRTEFLPFGFLKLIKGQEDHLVHAPADGKHCLGEVQVYSMHYYTCICFISKMPLVLCGKYVTELGDLNCMSTHKTLFPQGV